MFITFNNRLRISMSDEDLMAHVLAFNEGSLNLITFMQQLRSLDYVIEGEEPRSIVVFPIIKGRRMAALPLSWNRYEIILV